MAMPPFFKKYLREIFIATSIANPPVQLVPSAALEFRRAKDESGKQTFVDLFDWVIQARLQDLRILQARLERLSRLLIDLSIQEKLERTLQRHLRILRSIFAKHLAQIDAGTRHPIARKREGKI